MSCPFCRSEKATRYSNALLAAFIGGVFGASLAVPYGRNTALVVGLGSALLWTVLGYHRPVKP